MTIQLLGLNSSTVRLEQVHRVRDPVSTVTFFITLSLSYIYFYFLMKVVNFISSREYLLFSFASAIRASRSAIVPYSSAMLQQSAISYPKSTIGDGQTGDSHVALTPISAKCWSLERIPRQKYSVNRTHKNPSLCLEKRRSGGPQMIVL